MLSHLDDNDQPQMVDVGDKTVTQRRAVAKSIVQLTPEISDLLENGDIRGKKGPVFQTAILAGVMAAKRTAELIPLCHVLPLEKVNIRITPGPDHTAEIVCEVKVTHKTGVEMEALTGASVAALTIYDMCKAMSHEIVIRETRLLEKTGGKSDFTVK